MNGFLPKNLLSMLANVDEKKLSEAMTKASEIMKKHDSKEIQSAIMNNDLSKIMPEMANADISQLIDALPDNKKQELWNKFSTPEVQEIIKKDKSKAIDIIKQCLLEN